MVPSHRLRRERGGRHGERGGHPAVDPHTRTNPGERVMRPEFGAGLRALLFEPINAVTASRTKHRVERALIEWEPRIDGIAVGVTAARGVPRLDITVRYRVRSTNTFYNLVYPFYLREGRP
ncbi:MAG: GPW/gp25 family protein [Polyangiaceae bacterium]